jgi:hypothetical protein
MKSASYPLFSLSQIPKTRLSAHLVPISAQNVRAHLLRQTEILIVDNDHRYISKEEDYVRFFYWSLTWMGRVIPVLETGF